MTEEATATESTPSISGTGDGSDQSAKERMEYQVDITEAGPCQKQVKVTIPRSEIEKSFERQFSDLVKSASVPGFRPGKTPRRLIERRFRKDVSNQVKGDVLVRSMQQIEDEKRLDLLSEPDIDPFAIELPEEGDLVYEFHAEVRPDFELPDFQTFHFRKPVYEFSAEAVAAETRKLILRAGTRVPHDGPAESGDELNVDVRILDGDETIREFIDKDVQLQGTLYFQDARIPDFETGMLGVKAEDSRILPVIFSDEIEDENYRGKELKAEVLVNAIARLSPEAESQLIEQMGLSDLGQLKDLTLARMKSHALEQSQQEIVRQVLEKVTESATWELPPKLVERTTDKVLKRHVLSLLQRGFPEDAIRSQLNKIRQHARAESVTSLKQQFVLQAVTQKENIEVSDDDLQDRYRSIAQSSGESPRRVRARFEKEGLVDSVYAEILETKAIEKIIAAATVEEYPGERTIPVESTTIDERILSKDDEDDDVDDDFDDDVDE